MKYKLVFFILSILIILPGIYFLITSGLKLGIDFTGGALLEYQFKENVDAEKLKGLGVVTQSGENTFIIRAAPKEHQELEVLKEKLVKEVGEFQVLREENIGPVIGEELKVKSLIALGLACLVIVVFITFAFRKVPEPASSLRFGVAAIVALIHDVLVVVGVFAILGKFLAVEIDTLFVTALLTIVGFSVHDTIVVFDRIRENLPKHLSKNFSEVADISISQTLVRSVNTSLTVIFVLTALLLFGGESIRWFIVALLVGVISGTYSSIFNATALLAYWEEKLGH